MCPVVHLLENFWYFVRERDVCLCVCVHDNTKTPFCRYEEMLPFILRVSRVKFLRKSPLDLHGTNTLWFTSMKTPGVEIVLLPPNQKRAKGHSREERSYGWKQSGINVTREGSGVGS